MVLEGLVLRYLCDRITVDSQGNHARTSWPLRCGHLLQKARLGRSRALIALITTYTWVVSM